MVSVLPKPIRKMLAVFRGQVSPVFIFLSVFLGFWFGIMPGWSGIHTALLILVVILNIHTGLFLLTAGLGKTLCFAAAPVLFHLGAWIHAHLSGLLSFLASLPVIGITDFDRYSFVGALVVGPVVGAIAGLLLARSVIRFRRMLLKFEEGSAQFKKWYSRRWVRVLDRLLVGKRTKDAKSLFTAKVKIFRKAGVVFAVLVLAVAALVTTLLKDDAAKDYIATRMTQANGAEVNLDTFALSALRGAVSASGIEVTDPEKPEQNQVAIGKISADIGLYSLLVGKLVMDEVQVSDVQFGQERAEPGELLETDTTQKPSVFDPCNFKIEAGDIAKLETYLKDAKAVKEWLQKIHKWLPKAEEGSDSSSQEIPEEYLGYLKARAATAASPRILARKVLLDKVQIPSQFFGSSKVSLENISDSAWAAELPVRATLKSYDTPASVSVTFDFASAGKGLPISGNFDGLDLSKMQESLGNSAGLGFKKGTASGQITGMIIGDSMDLTVEVTIADMEATVQGDQVWGIDSGTASEALEVMKNLRAKIRIVGPVSEPRLAFDTGGLQGQLKEALVQAGKARLANEMDKQVEKQLGKSLGGKVPDEIGGVLKKPGELIKGLGGLLGGKKEKKE